MKVVELSAPLTAQVELTWECNHRCRHCYNFFRESENLPALTIKNVIHVVNELAKAGIFRIIFTGGEPLLHYDVLLAGIKESNKNNIKVGLNSNLSLLTENKAKELKSLGINSVLASFVSADESVHDFITGVPGSFQKVVKGIQIAESNGISVTANMVLTKYNLDTLEKTGKYLHGLGVKNFGATKATSPDYNCSVFEKEMRLTKDEVKKSLSALYELKDKYGFNVDVFEHYPHCLLGDLEKYSKLARRSCTAGKTQVSIGADGSIRPCSHSSHIYGNIFDTNGLTKAWCSMSDWRDGSYTPTKCRNCKLYPKCSGGCRVDAEINGDICGMESYASVEITDLNLPKITKKEMDYEGKWRLNKEIKNRKEPWGVTLYVDETLGYTMVSSDVWEYLKKLNTRKNFDIADTKFKDKSLQQLLDKLIHIKALIRY